MRWGTLTPVFLTADTETSLLQITVPQKAGTNTSEGGVSDTHVIKKSLKKYEYFIFAGLREGKDSSLYLPLF